MCGIAGVIGEGSAKPLVETITHRGPDGVRVEEGEGFSLAHARLSIIDLERGWQPLHAAGSTVIGNGEIYNYVELIEEFGLEPQTGTPAYDEDVPAGQVLSTDPAPGPDRKPTELNPAATK